MRYLDAPQFKAAFEAGHQGPVVFSQTVIDRTGKVSGFRQSGRGLWRIGWNDDRQSRHGSQSADILHGIVRRTAVSIFEAHPHAYDAHREVMHDRTVTNEFERPHRS